MKKWMKKYAVVLLAGTFTLGITPAPIQGAGILETAITGAAAMVYVNKEIRRLDDEGQEEMLQRTKEKTGYYDDEYAQARVRNIVERIEATPNVKRKYAVYVNPEDSFNAFMTIGGVMSVNKGALVLDDDSLAYVIGHEIAHGEHRDVVNGLKKSIGTSTLIQIATAGAGIGGAILGDLASNYIDNQVFTMDQEKSADKDGFKYLVEAGYNPGGAATSMAFLRDDYGDTYREGLSSVVAPNNHPKTSDRVTENVKRLKEYSDGHVDVKNRAVYVNDKLVYEPPADDNYSGEMRAYLMAGKLAKLYHDKQMNKNSSITQSDGIVYVGDVRIIGTTSETVAIAVRDSLATAIRSE